jgi:hypothetical protein
MLWGIGVVDDLELELIIRNLSNLQAEIGQARYLQLSPCLIYK